RLGKIYGKSQLLRELHSRLWHVGVDEDGYQAKGFCGCVENSLEFSMILWFFGQLPGSSFINVFIAVPDEIPDLLQIVPEGERGNSILDLMRKRAHCVADHFFKLRQC